MLARDERILVTGAGGLVGLHTALHLAGLGARVTGLDTREPGPVALAVAGESHSEIEWLQADVRDVGALERTMRERRIGGLIHAAALINETTCRDQPVLAESINVGGTAAALEAARRAGVRRIVLTSSATVYGSRGDSAPIVEEDARPEHVYGYTKFLAEQWLECCGRVYGLEGIVVRLSSVYGPGKRWNPERYPKQRLCAAAISGTHCTLAGREYARDFTHVADVARGIGSAYCAPSPRHTVYNIAAGRLYGMQEVAACLRALYPAASLQVDAGRFADDVALQGSVRGPLSIQRAAQDLGYAPRMGLREGLKDYCEFLARHPVGTTGR